MIESRVTNRLTIVPLFVDPELFIVLIHSLLHAVLLLGATGVLSSYVQEDTPL
jgi:hypothetical protein